MVLRANVLWRVVMLVVVVIDGIAIGGGIYVLSRYSITLAFVLLVYLTIVVLGFINSSVENRKDDIR